MSIRKEIYYKNMVFLTQRFQNLLTSLIQYINSYLIFYNVYINNSIIASDIKLILWILNYHENYQLNENWVINQMLEFFCNKFYRQRYTRFSKLDQHIKSYYKKTFMAKKIYIDKSSNHINQYFANFIINEQLMSWDKNDIYKYKMLYLISKVQLFLKLDFCMF